MVSTDPIEGMLAAQVIAAHEASMRLRQLAWLYRCRAERQHKGVDENFVRGRAKPGNFDRN